MELLLLAAVALFLARRASQNAAKPSTAVPLVRASAEASPPVAQLSDPRAISPDGGFADPPLSCALGLESVKAPVWADPGATAFGTQQTGTASRELPTGGGLPLNTTGEAPAGYATSAELRFVPR